ncbi:hypothetical protein D3C72_514130 [compost metagenome]
MRAPGLPEDTADRAGNRVDHRRNERAQHHGAEQPLDVLLAGLPPLHQRIRQRLLDLLGRLLPVRRRLLCRLLVGVQRFLLAGRGHQTLARVDLRLKQLDLLLGPIEAQQDRLALLQARDGHGRDRRLAQPVGEVFRLQRHRLLFDVRDFLGPVIHVLLGLLGVLGRAGVRALQHTELLGHDAHLLEARLGLAVGGELQLLGIVERQLLALIELGDLTATGTQLRGQ